MPSVPPISSLVAQLEARGVVFPPGPVRVDGYGDSDALSIELIALICAGKKRAGTGLVWLYESEREPLQASQVRPPVQPPPAARWRAGGVTLNAIHARGGIQARGREFPPSHTSRTTVVVCVILCGSTASPQKPAPRAAAELSTHRMPPPSETAANPSFNLTHSGLRPPRAS
jgi:hypothetical protein